MATFENQMSIAATPEVVFDAVAHIETFEQVAPDILGVEFLTESRKGVGTRFRETRAMGSREATTELEVTEYEAPRRVRLVSEEGGITWDTVFEVSPDADGTRLDMRMEATPHGLKGKASLPLITPMLNKALEKDLGAIVAWCEGQTASE